MVLKCRLSKDEVVAGMKCIEQMEKIDLSNKASMIIKLNSLLRYDKKKYL